MIINRTFENLEPKNLINTILDDLFDSLISAYYSEIKVISTASSTTKEDA